MGAWSAGNGPAETSCGSGVRGDYSREGASRASWWSSGAARRRLPAPAHYVDPQKSPGGRSLGYLVPTLRRGNNFPW